MTRGAALPSVLLALSLTSALAVGGAYVARQHAAIARVSQHGIGLLPAAELALVDAISGWDSSAMAVMPVGMTVSLRAEENLSVRTEVWATRNGGAHYWIVAEAVSHVSHGFRRRLGVVVTTSSGLPTVVVKRGWAELP